MKLNSATSPPTQRYVVAATSRRLRSGIPLGAAPSLMPDGELHAVIETTGGRVAPVTMCGLGTEDLHVFEGLQFRHIPYGMFGHQCADCRSWLLTTIRWTQTDEGTGSTGSW